MAGPTAHGVTVITNTVTTTTIIINTTLTGQATNNRTIPVNKMVEEVVTSIKDTRLIIDRKVTKLIEILVGNHHSGTKGSIMVGNKKVVTQLVTGETLQSFNTIQR